MITDSVGVIDEGKRILEVDVMITDSVGVIDEGKRILIEGNLIRKS
jgi:hypothetical protein